MADALAQINLSYPQYDEIQIARLVGVCPWPLIEGDGFAVEAMRLTMAIKNGAPWPWPGTFYDSPACFGIAQGIILSESQSYDPSMTD